MKKTVFLLAILLIAGTSSLAFAHGTGVSYEENKDGYKIDIGHDEFIAAEESTRFDFALYPENLDAIDGEIFTDVWVTVTQDKKIFFAGGIHKPVFGTTGFTYVFPSEGTYIVSARFQKEGDTVVKTEFPLTVIPSLDTKKEVNPLLTYGLIALGSLLLGGTFGFFIERRLRKNI